MLVQSLRVYPVKSTAPIERERCPVEQQGLRDDRRWMVVDGSGKRLNVQRHRALLHVRAEPGPDGGLTLSLTAGSRTADELGLPPLEVPTPSDDRRVAVATSRLATAVDAGDDAAAWFSTVVDHPVRLVWLDDPAARPLGPDHGGLSGDVLSFADAGPLLLTSTSSLEQLNDWIRSEGGEPVPMQRFRPNVVIDGDLAPFAEDGWTRLTIGDVDYRMGEVCDRCAITTIDTQTLAGGKEPIRALSRHRKWDGYTWFGIRIVPVSPGVITVGDEVRPGADVAQQAATS